MVRHGGKHGHAKPNQSAEERKDVWLNMVKSFIKSVGDSNEDLTVALEKICRAKKVPRRWTNLNKTRFVSFLKYLKYKITPSIADQLWELFSKVIEEEQKKIKRNNKQSKAEDETIDEKDVTKLIEEKMEN